MAGGTSRTERLTGIIREWRRMKTAGGTIEMARSTGTTSERGSARAGHGITRMDESVII